MRKAALITLGVLAFVSVGSASADTLSIIGVIVRGDKRLAGATVRLYSTMNKNGVSLAEDVASEWGLFHLYKTNIAGDIGDMAIVYAGDEGAEPVIVKVHAAKNGIIEVRVPDVVVKPTNNVASLDPQQAQEAITAVASREAVLVEAGVKDEAAAKAVVDARAREILSKVPKLQLDLNQMKQIPETSPDKFKNFKLDPKSLSKEAIEKNLPTARGRGGIQ